MLRNPLTFLALLGLLGMAAILHSSWWGLGAGGLAAWFLFDRWIRDQGARASYTSPEPRPSLPVVDLTVAADKGHLIEGFLKSAVQGTRAALIATGPDLAQVLHSCVITGKLFPELDPDRAEVFARLQPHCPRCSAHLSGTWPKQFMVYAMSAPAILSAEDGFPMPRDDGSCPTCGSGELRYVYDP